MITDVLVKWENVFQDYFKAFPPKGLFYLYYYMRNFCNLIGLEQWYFS